MRSIKISLVFILAIMLVFYLPLVEARETQNNIKKLDDSIIKEEKLLRFEDKVQKSLLTLDPNEEVEVYIITTDIYTLGDYLRKMGVDNPYGTVRYDEKPKRPLIPKIKLKASVIEKLSSLECVEAIFEAPKLVVNDRFDWHRAFENGHGNVIRFNERDISTADHHGASYVWKKYNITGDGIKIAVVDTGFDFANAELIDSYAVCEDPSSPYYGWPVVFDQQSMFIYLAYGRYGFDTSFIPYSGLWPSSFYVNTAANVTATGGYITFDGNRYKVEGIVSKSGYYHIGYHIDGYLYYYYFFGAQARRNVAVLVVDSTNPYKYDTVYVDLDNDLDFTDEKPCNISSPVSYRDDYNSSSGKYTDMWNGGDGYPDWSGGMIYFISDGKTPIPYSDVYSRYYGLPLRIPGNGELVAFIGEFFFGYTHGTMCASSALGRGRLFKGWPIGIAPSAKLIPLPFYGNVFDIWFFTQEGYDGDASTPEDGQAHITSNSFGWSSTHNDGWHFIDRVTDYIIRVYPYLFGLEPTNSFTIALGNGGPGYGTVTTPDPSSAINVGAGADMSYRRYLGWDNTDYESKYGDVIPFSARGPSANAKVLPDIIATGYLAFTAQSLNIYSSVVDYINSYYGTSYRRIGDGYVHMQFGSGTSMATPITAGGLALVYEAYKKTYGFYPNIFEAKAILKSGADDISHDVMTQGAGWLNVTRSVELAMNVRGVLIVPEKLGFLDASWSWNAGGYKGKYMDMFANIMFPGEVQSKKFIIYNVGNYVENVSLKSLTFRKVGEYKWSYKTQSSDDIYYFDITNNIPSDCDLVTIYMYYSYLDFDSNNDYKHDTEYFIDVLDFVDENNDGNVDVYNETNRFTVSQNTGNSMMVHVHDVKDRLNGRFIVRLRTITGKKGIDMHFVAEFYKKTPWTWLSLSTQNISLQPGNNVTVVATLRVPSDAPVGIHEGGIYVESNGRISVIPVIVNVAAKLNSITQVIEIKNIVDYGLYTNTQIRGYMDWYWRQESGDWRFFYIYIDESLDVSNYYMFADVQWEFNRTDIDVFIMATGDKDFLSVYFPEIYGEYPLTIKASSEQTFTDLGDNVAYILKTTSGGAREVQFSKAQVGLIGIMLHNVLYAGESYYENFTLKFYLSNITAVQPEINITLDITPTNIDDLRGSFEIKVVPQTNLEGLQVDSYGPAISESEFLKNVEVEQDDISGSDFILMLANAKYTKIVHLEGYSNGGFFYVHIWGYSDAPDLDLGVFYDANNDGKAQKNEFLQYCADADADEEVKILNPVDGNYIIKVLGYDVPAGKGHFDLYWEASLPVEKFTILSQPSGSVTGGQEYSIKVGYNLPPIAETYTGVIYVGPIGNPRFLSIPVTIKVIDHCPPRISEIYPRDNQIVKTSKVLIYFKISDEVVSGTPRYKVEINSEDYTAQFKLSENNVSATLTLADGKYNVRVSVFDGAGNSDRISWNFTVDTKAPYVVWSSIENNSYILGRSVVLELRFSEPMNVTSVRMALAILPNATIEIKNYSANLTTFYISISDLAAYQKYTLTVDRQARDANGIEMEKPFVVVFTVIEKPRIIATDPVQNAVDVAIKNGIVKITITFNNPMDKSSVENAIEIDPKVNIVSTEWISNTTIALSIEAKPGVTYKVVIKASARDIYGNQLESDFVLRFTTKPEKKEDGQILWLIILAIIVAVVIVSLALIKLRKSKEEKPEKKEEEKKTEEGEKTGE